jgi:hypothetical protein
MNIFRGEGAGMATGMILVNLSLDKFGHYRSLACGSASLQNVLYDELLLAVEQAQARCCVAARARNRRRCG